MWHPGGRCDAHWALDQNIYLTFNYKTAFITCCEAGCWVLTPTSTFINTRGFWFDSPSVFYNTTENHRLIFYTELITFIWHFSFQWARPVTQRGWSSLSGFPRDSGAEYTPTITTGGKSRKKTMITLRLKFLFLKLFICFSFGTKTQILAVSVLVAVLFQTTPIVQVSVLRPRRWGRRLHPEDSWTWELCRLWNWEGE